MWLILEWTLLFTWATFMQKACSVENTSTEMSPVARQANVSKLGGQNQKSSLESPLRCPSMLTLVNLCIIAVKIVVIRSYFNDRWRCVHRESLQRWGGSGCMLVQLMPEYKISRSRYLFNLTTKVISVYALCPKKHIKLIDCCNNRVHVWLMAVTQTVKS